MYSYCYCTINNHINIVPMFFSIRCRQNALKYFENILGEKMLLLKLSAYKQFTFHRCIITRLELKSVSAKASLMQASMFHSNTHW